MSTSLTAVLTTPVLLCCLSTPIAAQVAQDSAPARDAKQILGEISKEMDALDRLLDAATQAVAEAAASATASSPNKKPRVGVLVIDSLDTNAKVIAKIDELLDLLRSS